WFRSQTEDPSFSGTRRFRTSDFVVNSYTLCRLSSGTNFPSPPDGAPVTLSVSYCALEVASQKTTNMTQPIPWQLARVVKGVDLKSKTNRDDPQPRPRVSMNHELFVRCAICLNVSSMSQR